MKRFGIKKTKGNIVLLFVLGLLVGVIAGLRQPSSIQNAPIVKTPAPVETVVQ